MNPEKLQLQSADGAQINLDMLYQIAPSCFTEARGADGKVRRVVNFDVLRQLLGDATADTGEDFINSRGPAKPKHVAKQLALFVKLSALFLKIA